MTNTVTESRPTDEKYCPISKSSCPGVCVYAEIMENISVGLIVFDMGRKSIIFRNRLCIEMFKDIPLPDEFDSWGQMLLPKDGSPISASAYAPSTVNYNGRIYGYTVYGISERYVWIFIRDITEKTRLEAIAEAVNTSNNIGYIFSGVRHEIGNPVNSIKNALSVLEAHYETFSKETIMRLLASTLTDIRRLEDLLKSLKNFNMYEMPVLEEIDMALFMKRFLSLIEEDFKGKSVTITHRLHRGTERAYGDPRALQQVMLNIVTNSADALVERAEPHIGITVFRRGEQIRITVEDNGCGLSQERQKDLFRPFVTSKQKGTGLGLIIARKMLAAMNGTISIESHENRGTIVHIGLPACDG